LSTDGRTDGQADFVADGIQINDRHDVTEILLKVALNIINPNQTLVEFILLS
jgi:hypothetical protein